MIAIRVFLLALLLATLSSAPGQAQVYRAENGHATFTSEVPLHTFTGESDHLVGAVNLADQSVDFYLDLNTLETGIGKRDKDMRTTLDTKRYPFAEFVGRLVTPFDAGSGAEQRVQVRGRFTIHGVTRDVVVNGTMQKTASGLRVKAAWELNLEDYRIEPPRLLIVRVDPVQDLRIDVVLAPANT